MTQSIKFEDHQGLVHNQAMYGLKWAYQAGVSMTYEDMFQEASLAFVLATQGFNQDAGIKFSTYYVKVAFSCFRRTLGIMSGVKNINTKQREEIAARKQENKVRQESGLEQLPAINYGINMISFDDLQSSGDESKGNIIDNIIESSIPSPEEILEQRQLVKLASEGLSPLAELVLSWLTDPPEELINEVLRQRYYAQKEKRISEDNDGFGEFSIKNALCFLSMVHDTDGDEITNVRKELLDMGKKIGRLAA